MMPSTMCALPGNPRQATQEDILAIYKSLM